MITTEIGSCSAIVKSIATTMDGGYKIVFECNPNDQKVINKLMERYGQGKTVVELGIVGVEE